MADPVTILSAPIQIDIDLSAIISGASYELDPELDVRFDCQKFDVGIINRPGVIIITITPDTDLLSRTIVISTITLAITPSATIAPPVIISSSSNTIALSVSGDSWIIPGANSWIWTSGIGRITFEMDATGEMVRRPMSYNGKIYKIRKLGSSVIVYGAEGITRMNPHGVNWGSIDLSRIGLLSKGAMCGTESLHYYIDKNKSLYRLLPESFPELLDYSNVLSNLSSIIVMSYDNRSGVDAVYITDGTYGYFLNSSGLGQCPATITGVGYKTGTFYVVSPSVITNLPIQICTDIIDFGVRTEKTIMNLEFGTYVTGNLYAAIDYRWNKNDAFSTTAWQKVDSLGRVSFVVSATEFRIRAKLTTYEDIVIDYINVSGKFIHAKPIEGAAYDN